MFFCLHQLFSLPAIQLILLIVTFLAFQTTNILHGHTVHFSVPDIVMEFLINTIEFIPGAVAIIEIDLGFTMAVHAPSHAQLRELLHLIHFMNGTMAGLALYVSSADVLAMVEINVVGKVVNPFPGDGFCL